MTETETRSTPDLILEVAERMFAENGYRGVSVRSITRACGVNTAAIHYHFGSKQAVLEQIFARRCVPMNEKRLRLLAECGVAPGRPPLLEQVLEAYLRPSLVWPEDPEAARRFLRLRAVLAHEEEGLASELIARHFDHVSRRFIAAVRDALPDLPEHELYWRVHFLMGAQYYTRLNPGRIRVLSDGTCDPADAELSLRNMVTFFAAAFRLPATASSADVGSLFAAAAGSARGRAS